VVPILHGHLPKNQKSGDVKATGHFMSKCLPSKAKFRFGGTSAFNNPGTVVSHNWSSAATRGPEAADYDA
jgi:hypothetical protein